MLQKRDRKICMKNRKKRHSNRYNKRYQKVVGKNWYEKLSAIPRFEMNVFPNKK